LPSAEIPGVEAEWAFTLTDQWLLDGTFGWSDAKIAEATTLTLADSEGEDFSFEIAKGARLPLTPDWTATVGIEFRSQARVLEAQPFARFDFSYVGESVNSIAGIDSVVSGNPVETQKAYQTGDLRFGLERDKWTGSIFIDNIWDERANLYLSNRWAVQRQSVNRPRTIGVQFRYNF
jgi:outer membrane receptor protein involved in Fe transport